MLRRVTSWDGGGRLIILLSLRIGGGACPAGGVGDFTTCLPLGACTLHSFLIRTSALDAHDLFKHSTLYILVISANICISLRLRFPSVDSNEPLLQSLRFGRSAMHTKKFKLQSKVIELHG